ncbi:MAG: DedA family protein [Chloroflexota bacterium]|nr:DedA family protein [Chloroflexota bacterium]
MTELVNQIIQWIETIITAIGYPGVAFATFAENIFPPIPSEVVIPFAGFVAAESGGELTFVGVWIASTIGSVIGAVVIYYFGMIAGDIVVRSFLRRYGKWVGVSEADYDRALKVFRKYGPAVVFFGRVIPLIRTVISVPAGADHMPLPQFLLYTTLGSAIWSGLLAYAGYTLGANWEQVSHFMEQYSDVVYVILAVILVAVVGFFIYTRVRSRRNAAAVPTDVKTG